MSSIDFCWVFLRSVEGRRIQFSFFETSWGQIRFLLLFTVFSTQKWGSLYTCYRLLFRTVNLNVQFMWKYIPYRGRPLYFSSLFMPFYLVNSHLTLQGERRFFTHNKVKRSLYFLKARQPLLGLGGYCLHCKWDCIFKWTLPHQWR